MAAISVRGVDDQLDAALKDEARRRGLSVNRLVLDLLRQELGLSPGRDRRPKRHDLDHLAGSWADAEVAEFERNTAEFEQIDEALWRTSGS